jgi:hypothetical protein
VVARIEKERLILDLKAVMPEEDRILLDCLRQVHVKLSHCKAES